MLNHTSSIIAAREVIRLALSKAERPVATTKFGPHSAVLLHLLVEQAPGVPVIWIDTGFNTRATMIYAEQLTSQLHLNLKTFRPDNEWRGFIPEIDTPEHDAFTDQVKLEPFARAISQLAPDAWFSALRQEQTQHRSSHMHFNRSQTDLLKVCPLLHWSENDMDLYLAGNELPSEVNYFDPTKGAAHRECGLHVNY